MTEKELRGYIGLSVNMTVFMIGSFFGMILLFLGLSSGPHVDHGLGNPIVSATILGFCVGFAVAKYISRYV